MLDNRIRELAKRGVITHITLAPTMNGQWQAGFRDTGSAGYRIEVARDPVDALAKALDGSPVPVKQKRRDLIG